MSQDDSQRTPQKLIEALCDEEKLLTGNEFGRVIGELRECLQITPAEFAIRCGISLPTYYRWLQGNRPPQHRIEQLKSLLSPNAASSKTDKNFHTSLREYDQLLDRQVCCTRQWALKTYLPFRAAKHQMIKHRLSKLLLENAESSFNCIFYGEIDPEGALVSPWAAMNSFGQFKQLLYRQDSKVRDRIRGFHVTSKELAFELGLSTLSFGLTILEYDQEKKMSTLPEMDGREVDYFFEIPLALYPEEVKSPGLRSNGEEEIRWIEWPAFRSAQDWVKRKALLEAVISDNRDNSKVKEFLGTRDEIERFVPRDYPN